VIGKIEGEEFNDKEKDWHGHVSAVTVAPHSRRQGFASYLMTYLEDVTQKMFAPFFLFKPIRNGWYVDLFVRPSNKVAVIMY